MECVISTESTDSNVITAVDEPTVLPSAIGSDWVRVPVTSSVGGASKFHWPRHVMEKEDSLQSVT